MALNENQMEFARQYAIDRNATQAAIRAGYSEHTAKQQGARLLTNVDVRAQVERILLANAERVELSVASLTSRLLRLADKAERMDGPAAVNAARQTLMDAAKLNGLVVDTSEVITRSPEERAARLSALRAERERLARAH